MSLINRFYDVPRRRWIMPLTVLPSIIEESVLCIQGDLTISGVMLIVGFAIATMCVVAYVHAAWMVILAWVVANALPVQVSVSVIIPTLAAVFLISRAGVLQGLVAAGICTISELGSLTSIHPGDLSTGSFITIGGSFLVCTVISGAWGIRERRNARFRSEQQMARRKERLRMAERLHNSIVNDLVYIISLADGHWGETVSKEDGMPSVDTAEIAAVAYKALENTRTIISALYSENRGANNGESPSGPITELVRQQDARLSKIGFTGVTIVSGSISHCSDTEMLGTIESLLEEVYANILKHADKEHGYCVTVSEDDSVVTITAADTPSTSPVAPPLSGGVGMESCRNLVEDLGGTIRTELGEQWVVSIDIPTSIQNHNDPLLPPAEL